MKLYTMDTLKVPEADNLLSEKKRADISSLMLLTEKRDGRNKGRACANRIEQREHIDKDSTESTKVSLDSIFKKAVFTALKNWNVTVIDFPGAFLHVKCDEYVLMVMEGSLAELMAMSEPKICRKHMTNNNKRKHISFTKLQKTLHGMLKSAMLFHKKVLSNLMAQGFMPNPYDHA